MAPCISDARSGRQTVKPAQGVNVHSEGIVVCQPGNGTKTSRTCGDDGEEHRQ